MTVMTPAMLQGVIKDCITGNPIKGATVKINYTTALTNDTGYYSMTFNPGNFQVVFSKTGYKSTTVLNVTLTGTNTTTQNSTLCEQTYPPGCATASADIYDSACTVHWCLPAGPYEMLYDDGTGENAAAWSLPGNMNAVKFTPQGYPATVIGAKFFVEIGRASCRERVYVSV